MSSFGEESSRNLEGVDPRLVNVCATAIKIMDFKVLDGLRTVEEQKINVARGKSWTMNSKHLPDPKTGYSRAVDLAPWPVSWEDKEMFCVLAGVMRTVAFGQGIKLRWGGDWNQNDSTRDEKNRDYGHFEIVEE